MATIASLAVKIMANVRDLTKNVQDVVSSIDNIAKVTKSATPSMKKLEDSAKGLSIMFDAVSKAQERLDSSTPEGLLETQQIMTQTQETAEKLKMTVDRLGSGVAAICKSLDDFEKCLRQQTQTACSLFRDSV